MTGFLCRWNPHPFWTYTQLLNMYDWLSHLLNKDDWLTSFQTQGKSLIIYLSTVDLKQNRASGLRVLGALVGDLLMLHLMSLDFLWTSSYLRSGICLVWFFSMYLVLFVLIPHRLKQKNCHYSVFVMTEPLPSCGVVSSLFSLWRCVHTGKLRVYWCLFCADRLLIMQVHLPVSASINTNALFLH